MLAELLALWHVALAEALLLVALLVAINGLDDLAIDILWLVMPRHRRQPQPLPPAPPPNLPRARFAILIPAWDESAVIGAMLQRLFATLDWPDYAVFVGLYPNDPKGQAAVAALADPRLHMAVGATPGPTTKADCLNSLTEDYELGQHVHALGGRGRLVWVNADGQPVATREHFPASFDAAVRQKARWLTGIALAGWDRIGWRGGLINRWMLLRDRKAPLMALLTLAAYGIALLLGIDSLLRLALPAAARLPPVAGDVTRALLWLNWTLLCWRLLVRALFTLRVHDLSQAILTPPRALVGNFINAMAALRALSRYAQAVRTGRRLAWDKTIHRFPGFSP
jgi:Glycosyl transferase family group 2